MAFHDVRFSTVISKGSTAGPALFADIIRTDSGSNERVSRWPLPKRQYDASYGIRSQDDLYDTLEFFIARDGVVNGFRWKDWFDYTTGAKGRGAVSNLDELIGTGDGSNTSFQLIKSYEKGGVYEKQRPITKPVAGTLVMSVNGLGTTAFTLAADTGIVTMNAAPGDGLSVKAGFEFDVPVQFGDTLAASALQASLDNFDVGSIQSIPLVEMTGDVSAPERYFHGGGEARSVLSNMRYEWSWGMANVLVPDAARDIYLPNPNDLEPGIHYPYFYNSNAGAFSIRFRNHTDTATLFTFAQNVGGFTLVYTLNGVKTWGVISG